MRFLKNYSLISCEICGITVRNKYAEAIERYYKHLGSYCIACTRCAVHVLSEILIDEDD